MANMLFLLTVIVGVVWHGVVLKVLWGWFLVPLFGLIPLNLSGAIGICMIARLLTSGYREDKKSESQQELLRRVSYMLSTPLVALAIGWITHFFI